MNGTKQWWESSTIWANAITKLVSLAAVAGYVIDPAVVQGLPILLALGAQFISALISTRGRLRATDKIVVKAK